MTEQKRVMAIHDISGVGKCSLTVALPIISAAGVECSVLPTAVLSTHTGGFTGFTYRDLTEDIAPMAAHWKKLKLHFDAIYTGFLGSFAQIKLVDEVFSALAATDTFLAVDPVMADNGVLYSIFDASFPMEMKKLCARANLIMPNITEATLMLGEDYREGPYTEAYIEHLLQGLSVLGAEQIVLTGVWFNEKELGAAAYDAVTGKKAYIMADKVDGSYHGTGDVFGSALVGALETGHDLNKAVRIAVDFTVKSILWTKEAKTEIRYGVNFEANLPSYMRDLGLLDR